MRIIFTMTSIIFFPLAREQLVSPPPPTASPGIRWHRMFFKANLAGSRGEQHSLPPRAGGQGLSDSRTQLQSLSCTSPVIQPSTQGTSFWVRGTEDQAWG